MNKKYHFSSILGIVSFLTLSIMLSACFSPWQGDAGTIIISFGSNAPGSRAAVFNSGSGKWASETMDYIIPALEHRITLKRSTETITHTLAKGVTTGKFIVPSGLWEVTVEALYENVQFAISSAHVEVKGGQTNPLTLQMNPGDTTFYTAGTGEWNNTVTEISATGTGKKYCIILTGDNNATGSTIVNATFGMAASVTIVGNHTISLTGTGYMLITRPGQTVTIKDVQLKGLSTNNMDLVRVSNGVFIMEGNSSIYGNKTSGNGGGVYIDGGTFNMNGGAVYGNYAEGFGGGVYVSGGTFTMNGGTIYGNTADSLGGGVCVGGGQFYMQGGTIYGTNEANNSLHNTSNYAGTNPSHALYAINSASATVGGIIIGSTTGRIDDTIRVVKRVWQ